MQCGNCGTEANVSEELVVIVWVLLIAKGQNSCYVKIYAVIFAKNPVI